MSKYVINDTTLTAIGDAVREKGGTTELIPVSGLADAIINLPSGGGGEVEPIVISGDGSYACAGPMGGTYIDLFGNTVSTNEITNAQYMFYGNTAKRIPFELNFKASLKDSTSIYTGVNCTYMFGNAKCDYPPAINNMGVTQNNYMFYGSSIIEIPEDYMSTWAFIGRHSTSTYSGGQSQNMFQNCHRLRRIKDWSMCKYENINKYISYSSSIYGSGFYYCYVLESIDCLPVHTEASWTSNAMSNTFTDCWRLGRVVFDTQDDGTPYVCNGWSKQSVNLAYVGYLRYTYNETTLNSRGGITIDKRVSDDASYQALKNDPDWYAYYKEYSRYNHASAVETINSLPDVTSGSGNTIYFMRDAGSKTDGGACGDLTEEEIAVAAARGWTVAIQDI